MVAYSVESVQKMFGFVYTMLKVILKLKKKKKLLIKKIIPKYWISIIYFKNIIWQYWAYISLLIIG